MFRSVTVFRKNSVLIRLIPTSAPTIAVWKFYSIPLTIRCFATRGKQASRILLIFFADKGDSVPECEVSQRFAPLTTMHADTGFLMPIWHIRVFNTVHDTYIWCDADEFATL
ncbi:hypothetical protein AUP42_05235 [Thalassospira lucentensis]|uniref:Uncharacterized protein n=1 Tax=Thalassospira lucentensis TaxID=168935 RepID=A0A154L2W1_9PROT|nr:MULTISPECIES: hypothetical protein [Thalassospira]KZB62349.1 hypothetical protein AUP42_05235 [Thalassospira lucentensis]MCH2275123.1 hypothetical protein [Thalassospira sp.]